MSLEHFMNHAISEWMRVKGPLSDVVFSSRIRVARNLDGFPFPMLSTASQAEEVIRKVEQALKQDQSKYSFLAGAELIRMKDLSDLEKSVLVEKHLISPMLAEESRHGAVLLNKAQSVSIMINEEDHIRIQVLFPGLQMKQAWELANEIDDWLESHLNFAFDEKCGYLTSCPTNVGTGIRASVMLHLPALAMTQQLNRLLPAITQVGLAVRGIYGEGSEALGQLYQVSNQVTLGLDENEILENLQGVVRQMIEHEHTARGRLQEVSLIQLEDRVHRSYGTLAHCRIIDSKEAMSLLSDVRLGIDLGFIRGVSASVMNELMVMIQPGFLQQYAGERLNAEQRDIRRARLIRERLAMEHKS
ncbi:MULTISPECIES: protein arginine kinase [Thermoactinomyces]|jgi:protein arginine kinase|uniref:Protein-arginine kinase n=1 Tax=Thermoactinomyces vulgaris TaxID=2026 RepID=A0ABS0QJD4_THEVU|nr:MULTISPECIES: protein arginine kinase [Thermoactinomyces]KFZ39817.1 ATP:guanido phosphotransferase [Thermoactinomyces sp. Gus2-1]KYQ85833.1 ATP--guanido phosphotransferase [Thermoactinomyces sp. AS95]MBA4552416.1 protein arginine kinase [Thermoactinomyces vulgaris]MBA4596629.1 protein arginine kinase [Thermoactinomyces vulgaris]MBH8584360.1 protein arginine kinase [Thermoactinomyces sp. CICC 10735]